MKFRTQIGIKKEKYQIDYNSKVLLIGSCFANNMSAKLEYFKFQNKVNPFGILFHPKAIEDFITNTINQKRYAEEDVFYLNERWQSFETHSEFSDASKETLLLNLNNTIDQGHHQLNQATHLIITLGTSWVYRFIDTDSVVANCHKIPQKKFLKELLTVDEISESLDAIIRLVQSINQDIKIIFTVSPIRHLKDGFTENTQSKAHLLTGIHSIVDGRNQTYYFPSYEIMMDDLRDYRFYDDDMIHPNDLAIEYIWDQFKHTWVDKNSYEIMDEINAVQKGKAHKPFDENSEKHRKFLNNLNEKIAKLKKKFPQIEFKS